MCAVNGAIGASRTRDPLLRRQMLYPSELQPHRIGIIDTYRVYQICLRYARPHSSPRGRAPNPPHTKTPQVPAGPWNRYCPQASCSVSTVWIAISLTETGYASPTTIAFLSMTFCRQVVTSAFVSPSYGSMRLIVSSLPLESFIVMRSCFFVAICHSSFLRYSCVLSPREQPCPCASPDSVRASGDPRSRAQP